MSKIISIGTAVPAYCHQQMDILHFMQRIYAGNAGEERKMKFLYHNSGIRQRYSVIPDYSRQISDWKFYPQSENLEPFPSLEQRMLIYQKQAPQLSVDAIRECLSHFLDHKKLSHLITVSCTGMSAPGLDLQIIELMDFDKTIARTSLNFMGCYAAVHALKIADAICKADNEAMVLIVCTELCTLHFQKENTMDNIASSLLFGDGASAALITGKDNLHPGLQIDHFYSEILPKGKRDMAWELSSTGFLMTLSGYIPDLVQENFIHVAEKAMARQKGSVNDITHWCIHPGGKRILEAIEKSLGLRLDELKYSYEVLNEFGNLSSASILFVLKKLLQSKGQIPALFTGAFGPGLTIETFTAHYS